MTQPARHTDSWVDSAKHYEHDALFFESFLDGYMKYGAGYFLPGDSFERASVRMLDRAIDSATLPAQGPVRVLDVGSGWGSLFRRLRERLGHRLDYRHVNPSSVQREHIAARIGTPAWTHGGGLESACLEDRAHDAIFVHDSFCHLADKRAMLAKLARSLVDGGRLLVQDTFFVSQSLFERHRAAPSTQFIQNEVFGFAEIRAVQTLVEDAAEAGLRLVFLEDISDHYQQTVEAWLSRLGALDAVRFPLRDPTRRMLLHGASCLGYTTAHCFVVLAAHQPRSRALKDTLRRLRASERAFPVTICASVGTLPLGDGSAVFAATG